MEIAMAGSTANAERTPPKTKIIGKLTISLSVEIRAAKKLNPKEEPTCVTSLETPAAVPKSVEGTE